MKKCTCRALSFILALSLLMTAIVFAQSETYTIQMYKNGSLVDTYNVSAGNSQTLESGTVSDGKYLKGWLSADGAVLYGSKITPDKDMELHALYGSCAKPVPGINLFENSSMDENLFDVRPSNGEVFFETENENRVIRYKRNSGYASLMHYVSWDAGRKYDLSFKIKSEEAQAVWYNTRYKRESDSNIDRGAYAGLNQADTWSTYNYTFTIADDYISSENDAITFFSDPGTQIVNNDNIYDDLSLIPYFRLSYNLNGGETGAPASEYTLDKAYTINPSSVPERSGYTFDGWALGKNSRTTVTEVEFDDEDITLYAVWSMDESALIENVAAYIPETDKAGVADGTVNVVCSDSLSAYQTAELYYGDEAGIFSDYTMLASLALTDGAASYTMSGSRALPSGASRIYVTLKGGGLEPAISYCEIPDENQLDITDMPIVSFYSISDIHVGNDYWPEIPVNRSRAVADIQKLSPDFVAIVGDLVDHGIKSEYEVLDSFLKTSFNDKNIPAFITNGNHELFDINYQHSGYDTEALYNAYNKQLSFLGQNPDISISRDENSLFYSATFKDRKLIFMSTPEISGKTATYNISAQQLEWLDEQLYDGEKSNKTTLVFSHIGLKGYIPYRPTTGLDSTDAVVEILNRHPNTLIMSGHTHTFLDDDSHITKVGDMQNNFSALNDGCSIWLNSTDGEYFKDYSMGQYIEVYSDKILIKARQFTDPGMFISKGLYIIEMPDSEEEVGTAQIDGNVEDKSVLTAKLDGEDAPAGSTYEWRIGSTVVGTEKNYTVETKPEYAGKKIVLRITLPNGLYSSCISDKLLGEYKVSYDLNGGEGTVPPRDKAVKGVPYKPYQDTYFPTKAGGYFVGWATDKNAETAETDIDIKSDTTLYAVYSDKPEFHFEANLSGFEATYGVESVEIKNNTMICTSGSSISDLFFTLNNANIDADKYKYLRVKVKLDEGTGTDCMYFDTDEKSFNYSSTRLPFYPEYIVASADGMNIYELYIPNVDTAKVYWHGTVNKLRYDVIEGYNGRATTDYIVFSDKKAVFKADITVTEPKKGEFVTNDVALSDDTANISISEAAYDTTDEVFRGGKAYTVSVKLLPDEGYEFTTAEDMKSNIKINGKAVSNAVINSDGTATVSYSFEKLAQDTQGSENSGWSVWDGSVDDEWGADYNNKILFEINNASQFIAFRNMVLEGNTFRDKQVLLNCNIDLNNLNLKHGVGDKRSEGWTSGVDLTMFGGVFNGNGHIIKNLSMNPNIEDTSIDSIENSYCIGLFFASDTAQIMNLGLEDVNITLHNQLPPEANYAGLLSINSYATVSGCYVKNITFYGGWSEDSDSITAYFAGLAARCVGGTIKNSYVDGVDYTKIKKGLFNKSAIKTGIALASGGTTVQNCYSANIKYNLNDTTDESAADPYSKIMNNYEATVYDADSSCTLSKLYAEVPCRIASGVVSSSNNASGTLAEAMVDVASTLGESFADLSHLKAFPRLNWENLPEMFTYDVCEIYKNYGKITETAVTGKPLSNDELTLEISGIKNETGIDLKPVVSFVYVSGGVMKKHNYTVCNLPAFTTLDDAVTLKFDLSGETIKDGDFVQVIVYRAEDKAIPLIPAISIR